MSFGLSNIKVVLPLNRSEGTFFFVVKSVPLPTETAFLPHQPSISSGGHESECSSLYDPNSGPTNESKMCSTLRA